jgi:hypothetical protein
VGTNRAPTTTTNTSSTSSATTTSSASKIRTIYEYYYSPTILVNAQLVLVVEKVRELMTSSSKLKQVRESIGKCGNI